MGVLIGECDCCGRGPRSVTRCCVYGIETYACGDTDYDEDIDDELDFQSLLSTIQDGLSL